MALKQMILAIKDWVGKRQKALLFQTLFLFGVDLLTNGVDYVFHIYLGRALIPGDFAVFQTVNSMLIVVITAFGVFQPVVARFVAEAEEKRRGGEEEKRGSRGGMQEIFWDYFRWSSVAGLGLAGVVLVSRNVVAAGLNVPPLAVTISAGVVLMSFSRPVVWGMLQGQQRFIAFGLTRLMYAVSRFAVAAGLIAAGWAAMGAVTALPVGMGLSWSLGLAILWRALTPHPPLPRGEGEREVLSLRPSLSAGEGKQDSLSPRERVGVRAGWRLAGFAFVAYAAYTAMLNLDMLWVNRMFSPEEAGAYAGAVLLRRILLLLPGVVVVVFYPRVVAMLARRELPDRLLALTMGVVGGTVLMLTGVYFVAGDWIVQVVFGEAFALAGPLLGWLGVGILGYSIGSIWMNLALATRPAPFVGLLVGAVVGQALGLAFFAETLPRVVGVFVLFGWVLAVGGGMLYGCWLRPRLVFQLKEAK